MNVLSDYRKDQILLLVKKGVSFREISRRLGVKRHTVSKYAKEAGWCSTQKGFLPELSLGEDSKRGLQSSSKKKSSHNHRGPLSRCEPYREWITQQVELGRQATVIYEDLVDDHGFQYSYHSVKAFVRKLRQKEPKKFRRLKFDPGEEAQVDYGLGALTRCSKTGKLFKPRLFVMTLKYSGKSFFKVVERSSSRVWAELHEEAFHFLGGCPTYVVTDNLKEAVIKPDLYDPKLNPVYAAMLNHHGVVAVPARVRDPNRKGSVESAVKHAQNKVKGMTFDSFEEQNEYLMKWEREWASKRNHGRYKERVQKRYEKEKAYLSRLPLEKFCFFEEISRTISNDGRIIYDNSYYCCNPLPTQQKVIARVYDHELVILHPETGEVFRRHPLSSKPGSDVFDPKDQPWHPEQQHENLFKDIKKIGPKTLEFCQQLLFQDANRVGRKRLRGVIALTRRFHTQSIEMAASELIERNIFTYERLQSLTKSINEKKKPWKNGTPQREEFPQNQGVTQKHRLIRPLKVYQKFCDEHASQD